MRDRTIFANIFLIDLWRWILMKNLNIHYLHHHHSEATECTTCYSIQVTPTATLNAIDLYQ